MIPRISLFNVALFLGLLFTTTSCSWFQNGDDPYACTTCYAYPNSGQQEVSRTVCSAAEENDFRREYSNSSPYCVQ